MGACAVRLDIVNRSVETLTPTRAYQVQDKHCVALAANVA